MGVFPFPHSGGSNVPSTLEVRPFTARFTMRTFSYSPRTYATAAGSKLFDKILIANRGEIACRVMRTCEKMGIRTVAIYSEPDATAVHVRMADEAYCVGPAASSESYLNVEKILDVIKTSGAQAVHPGYGFLSENYHFYDALHANNIKFIGPSAKSMKAMGDKIESKKIAKRAGVNVIPGVLDEIHTPEEVVKIANEIGYPVMIKASAGGGGKGMRIAWNDEEAIEGFQLSKQEAKSSFGDDRMLIEKFIDNPRHIEIQILVDSFGNAVYLNERECSIQRRNQKVIEEAPSPFLTPEVRAQMGKQAVALALSEEVEYQSAGTVEMLVDSQHNFYFLEMNTRLQVEHPITEQITGVDIVEHMIKIAAGGKLPYTQDDIGIKGWAVESRVYAEDPLRKFLPSIGLLTSYSEPTSEMALGTEEGIRVDSGITEGSEISMFYDPMISKLVTYGKDRGEAIDRMRHALDTYIIKGLDHNICFLRAVMDHPRFLKGDLSTKFIGEEYPQGFHGYPLSTADIDRLVSLVAVIRYEDVRRDESISGQLYSAAPEADIEEVSLPLVVTVNDTDYDVVVTEGDQGIEVSFNNGTHTVQHNALAGEPTMMALVDDGAANIQVLERLSDSYNVQFLGSKFNVKVRSHIQQQLERYMPVIEEVDHSNMLLSPMPGKIVSVNVKEGDKVVFGQLLIVVEAMKMQNNLRCTKDGVVKSVHVKQGSDVGVDAILIEFES